MSSLFIESTLTGFGPSFFRFDHTAGGEGKGQNLVPIGSPDVYNWWTFRISEKKESSEHSKCRKRQFGNIGNVEFMFLHGTSCSEGACFSEDSFSVKDTIHYGMMQKHPVKTI